MPDTKGIYNESIRRTFAWKMLCKGILFERNSRLMVAGFSLIPGAFFFLFPAESTMALLWLRILGCVFLLLAAGLTVYALRIWNPENAPVMQLLLSRPLHIVWVYTVITEKLPYGFNVGKSGHIFFRLMDGNSHVVSLLPEHLKRVSEDLNIYLPHATFGYSKDKEQWYMASPHLLVRDSEGRDI